MLLSRTSVRQQSEKKTGYLSNEQALALDNRRNDGEVGSEQSAWRVSFCCASVPAGMFQDGGAVYKEFRVGGQSRIALLRPIVSI
jgi:hypothetical protein